jgi:hypothetical protein
VRDSISIFLELEDHFRAAIKELMDNFPFENSRQSAISTRTRA